MSNNPTSFKLYQTEVCAEFPPGQPDPCDCVRSSVGLIEGTRGGVCLTVSAGVCGKGVSVGMTVCAWFSCVETEDIQA